jgi:hypothetical protein
MAAPVRRFFTSPAGKSSITVPVSPSFSRLALAAALALAAVGTPVAARTASGDDLEDQVRRLQEELDRLRTDNESIRREVTELRAITEDEWLTEQRAEEIRGIVEEVLVDSEMRSSLSDNGLMAGWSEHFFLASPDGRFKLQIGGQMQIRWVFNHQDEPDKYRYGFENTRTKLTLNGHVFTRDLTYLIRWDITRNEPGLVTGLDFLQDAWIRWALNGNWSVRFGQFKLPFMREELVSSSRQLAVERSLVNENTSIGRSQGIELTWAHDASKFSFVFSDAGTDQLGGFGTVIGTSTVINTPALTEDTEFAFTARYEHLVVGSWSQFEDLTSPIGEQFGLLIGVAGHWQQGERTGTPSFGPNEADWGAWTADVSVEWGGANAFASFTHHYIESALFGGENIHVLGFVVQGGMYLSSKLEAFARYEYGWWDLDEVEFSDLSALTVGVNYYIDGHDLKWSADFGIGFDQVSPNWDSDIAGWRPDAPGADPQFVFRTQFQLLF